MLGLPSTTEVNRPMPKAQLYKKFELKQAQRDAFDADVARMEIVNFIAPQTLPAITVGSEVQAIFVINVELKHRDYDTKNILLISKLIPHRMIFVLRHNDMLQLAVYHTKLFTAPWQSSESVNLTLSGLNLDSVWDHIVATIGSLEVAKGNSLTEQIRVDDERNRVLRQVEALECQMRSSTQPRRQRELYAEIKKLKSLL